MEMNQPTEPITKQDVAAFIDQLLAENPARGLIDAWNTWQAYWTAVWEELPEDE